jgi:hypothetical protein
MYQSRLISTLIILMLCLWLVPATAQTLAERGTVLDHLTGRWVMTGVIAGDEITHDLEAQWVLGGHYLYFHELARERDENGLPAYEARVYIGWDETSARLVCMWLDVTGGGGLTPEGFGYAQAGENRIPFVWAADSGSGIHNTFIYQPDKDFWEWQIDNVRDGQPSAFARVVLKRHGAVD